MRYQTTDKLPRAEFQVPALGLYGGLLTKLVVIRSGGWQKCLWPRDRVRIYFVVLLDAETPTTICVPPSNSISLLAPSRMLEACAILGSCCPGTLLAKSTPGIEVVEIAMLPFLATTVPAAGPPSPACAVAGSAAAVRGALLGLLPPFAAPRAGPGEAGAADPLTAPPGAGPPVDAEPSGGAID